MTDTNADLERRAKLKGMLAELDKAQEAVRTARKPFDDAIMSIEGLRDTVLESYGAEVAGECESCDRLLLVGDQGFRCDDGPVLCADCAPTFGDAAKQWEESDATAYEPENAARRTAFNESLRLHLAAGGKLEDKVPCWEL